MSAIDFDYISPYRGLRGHNYFMALANTHHALENINPIKDLTNFYRLLKYRAFNRTASAAGPLAMNLAKRFQRPKLIKSELERQAKIKQGDTNVPPPSTTAGGPSGKGAKGGKGFAAASKGLLSMMPGMGKTARADDDEGSGTDYSDWVPVTPGGIGMAGDYPGWLRSQEGQLKGPL